MPDRRLAACLALAGLAAAAATAMPAGADPAPQARAAAVHTVKFGEYFYRPKKLTIRRGEKVRFLNVGKVEHTVADSTKSGTIRSKIIHPRPLAHGKSQTVTFKKAGTVYYLCTFHPTLMKGVVVVK